MFTEPPQGSAEEMPHGPGTPIQPFRDLGVGQTGDARESDHFPFVLRKHLQRRFEALELLLGLDDATRREHSG